MDDVFVKKSDPILEAEGLKKQYGELVAVNVNHLEIQRGQVTAIIGPNGAGKTTFFNLLTGFTRPNQGSWVLNKKSGGQNIPTLIGGLPTYQIARAGMVRTFQVTKTLDRMTVMENMLLSSQKQMGEKMLRSVWPNWKTQQYLDTQKAEELLARYGLKEMKNNYTSTLSGGQRKLLEISRALMADPELLLLDEPLAGVNPALIEKILGYMRDLANQGVTIVFVEHNMDAVVDVSDWVVCLAEGSVIAEAEPKNLINNQAVIDAYLGR